MASSPFKGGEAGEGPPNPRLGSVLFLPSCMTSLRTSYEGLPQDQNTGKRKNKGAIRKPKGAVSDAEADVYNPHNYLMKGGARMAEQKIQSMNRAAIKDLRCANDMLASELMRMRTYYEDENTRLKDANTRMEGDMRMLEEKLRQAHEKLETEVNTKASMEVQHMARLRELTKRLRDEHNQFTAASAELNQHKVMVASLGTQVSDLGELRGEVARLESSAACATATIADLRERLAAMEDKLGTETQARAALQSRVLAAESSSLSMTEKASLMAASLAEMEAQLATARHHLQDVTQDLAYSKTALQQEQDAHAAVRRSTASLHADLTELQTSSTLAAAQAAADKSELERVRREMSEMRISHESEREELMRLREEAVHTRSELASYKASAGELTSECTQLRSQLLKVTEDLGAEVAFLRESKATELSVLNAAKDAELAALRESKANEVAEVLKTTHAEMATLRQSAAVELTTLKESSAEQLAAVREHHAAELAVLRESTSTEIEHLRKQLSTYQYQKENHAHVFEENKTLTTRLQRTENALRQKEAVLAEALSSHATQLELWRGEANEVAQAASKWKQRAIGLQQQLSSLESSSSRSTSEVTLLSSKCASLEMDKARLSETCASLESQLSTCQQELSGIKAQLKESLALQAAVSRQAESSGHEAAQRTAALDRLSARLAEETAKTASLRQELATVSQQQVRELDGKSRMLSELTAALAQEERGRDAAVREATSLRSHLATLERELRNAQAALSSISDDRVRSRTAYDSVEAALSQAQRQALLYKQENKELLELVDTHQQHHQPYLPPQSHYTQPAPSTHLPPSTTTRTHAPRRPASAPLMHEGPSQYASAVPAPSSPPPTPPSPRTSLAYALGQPNHPTTSNQLLQGSLTLKPRPGPLEQLLEEAVGPTTTTTQPPLTAGQGLHYGTSSYKASPGREGSFTEHGPDASQWTQPPSTNNQQPPAMPVWNAGHMVSNPVTSPGMRQSISFGHLNATTSAGGAGGYGRLVLSSGHSTGSDGGAIPQHSTTPSMTGHSDGFHSPHVSATSALDAILNSGGGGGGGGGSAPARIHVQQTSGKPPLRPSSAGGLAGDPAPDNTSQP